MFQARRLVCANVKWDKSKLNKIVKENKVMFFMKGVPSQMCGLSNDVVQVLRMHAWRGRIREFNILDDENLRREMKTYSNWPTLIFGKMNLILRRWSF